jgi:hypothetical protein
MVTGERRARKGKTKRGGKGTSPAARSFGGQQWPAVRNSLRRRACERRGCRHAWAREKGRARTHAQVL